MGFSPGDRESEPADEGTTTFQCPCGAVITADDTDDVTVVAKRHWAEQHAADPLYSDMDWDAQIGRSRTEAEDP